jgi:hypothetical protein
VPGVVLGDLLDAGDTEEAGRVDEPGGPVGDAVESRIG